MKVLMYGWEFAPVNQGGLGVACKGIVHGLVNHGVSVNLVLPYYVKSPHEKVKIINASKNLTKSIVFSAITPYQTEHDYLLTMENKSESSNSFYSKSLFAEVERYRRKACEVQKNMEYDVIHAHDWITYPAAVEAKKCSGKALIAHIHATEFDRTGDNPNPLIFEIEKMGFSHADKIIAVSNFTKQKIVEHYGIDPGKIEVVHNSIIKQVSKSQRAIFSRGKKTVLFLGRMTMQKGPEYFLRAAKRVLEVEEGVNFIMAGDGDMMARMINLSIDLGIEKNVIFPGFLKGSDVDSAFKSADLFVMPSVSEPFGLVALESIHNGTPILISKQSGVSEVIPNALKVDFWDVDEIANKVVSALRSEVMRDELRERSMIDLDNLSWRNQTDKINDIYKMLVS